jgi:hypothetical protein
VQPLVVHEMINQSINRTTLTQLDSLNLNLNSTCELQPLCSPDIFISTALIIVHMLGISSALAAFPQPHANSESLFHNIMAYEYKALKSRNS